MSNTTLSPTTDEFFPVTSRVFFRNSPLSEVVCALRFPPLLKIEGELPAKFQERVRSIFPLFERAANPMAQPLPPQVAQFFGPRLGGVAYQFMTENRNTTLTLQTDSIGLTTTEYRRWEDFRGQLQEPLRALIDIYQPSFFNRIGLRYTDAIIRSKLGLSERKWHELLRAEIAGELGVPKFEENADAAHRVFRLRSSDGGAILLQHGIAQFEGRPESCYRIDFDFSTEQKTEVTHAESILDAYSRRAGSAFRWCITDVLRDALGPSEFPAESIGQA